MLATISPKQKIAVLVGVMLGLFLAALDQTIVATAMPRIVQDFNGLSELSWVFTAYMLASTVTVPIYGKLSDLYGRKIFMLGAIVVFVIGSILSGFSQSMVQLILFRAIQGIGGGALMANSFAVIGDLFPPSERGKWQGLFGGVFGLASVVGPTLGGFLTDNFSWRWNFFINIPVGIVGFVVILFLMPTITSKVKSRSIDYLGAILFALGLIPLLLGFVWGGNQFAWSSWQIISLFIFAIAALVAFGIAEKNAQEPILPLSLFKNSIFSLSAFIIFFLGVGMFGAILYLPLFAQLVIGVSATNSGVVLTPLMLGMVVASITSGQVISRTGKYKWLTIIGLSIIVGSLYWLSLMDETTTQTDLIIRMIVTGIGLGITMPIFNISVQNAFDHSKLGVVTSAVQLFRSIGATVGVAILGSFLNHEIAQKLAKLKSDQTLTTLSKLNPQFSFDTLNINTLQGILSPQGNEQVTKVLANLPHSLQMQAQLAFSSFIHTMKGILASSISDAFFLAAILMAIALGASFFLEEIPLRKSHHSAVEEAGIELALEDGNLPAKDEPEL